LALAEYGFLLKIINKISPLKRLQIGRWFISGDHFLLWGGNSDPEKKEKNKKVT
jgi:hypothetical protein